MLQLSLTDHALDRRWQGEQPQGVADRGSAPAGPWRDLLMGQAEVLDELLVRAGFLERVELLALEVLDQRLLERRAVVGLPDRARGSSGGRPGVPPRQRRSPAISS